MKMMNAQLDAFVVAVAAQRFGSDVFNRRALMSAAEIALRHDGFWSEEDDAISSSAGIKSAGLARIDWAISRLKQSGRLLNLNRNLWRVTPRGICFKS